MVQAKHPWIDPHDHGGERENEGADRTKPGVPPPPPAPPAPVLSVPVAGFLKVLCGIYSGSKDYPGFFYVSISVLQGLL